jgi:uncharacterized membrane protein YphA (DoxX/SURF4 family)
MANKKPLIYFILNYAIALIWLLNGLFCKLLNFVPRHQQIVGRILGDEYSFVLIKLIGVSEVLMCIWIMSRMQPRLCAVSQIIIILTMNTIELLMTPDLLLYGRYNFYLALLLTTVIFVNEFVIGGKLFRQNKSEKTIKSVSKKK